MPRLIPRRARWRDDAVLIALETLPPSGNFLRPRICKGEVVRGSDYRVKTHPDNFAPPPEPEGSPSPDEPYAIPRTAFVVDGHIISRDLRFYLYDPLVLNHPGYFQAIVPNP